MPGRVIQVAKVPKTGTKPQEALDLLAQLCYHYPAYTLKQARKLPYAQVVLMLRVAHREQAKEFYNLTQIAAAPHTKKGTGVKKLSDTFMKEAKVG